jgi:hypothetical protein
LGSPQSKLMLTRLQPHINPPAYSDRQLKRLLCVRYCNLKNA